MDTIACVLHMHSMCYEDGSHIICVYDMYSERITETQ
jgi:hypothetical protein